MTWYAMPDMVTDELARDREALGLDRRKYVLHVLMRRYHEVLESGPAFDGAAGAASRARKGKEQAMAELRAWVRDGGGRRR